VTRNGFHCKFCFSGDGCRLTHWPRPDRFRNNLHERGDPIELFSRSRWPMKDWTTVRPQPAGPTATGEATGGL
jgi:hypothetical protein